MGSGSAAALTAVASAAVSVPSSPVCPQSFFFLFLSPPSLLGCSVS